MNLMDFETHIQKKSHRDKLQKNEEILCEEDQSDADTLEDETGSFISCSNHCLSSSLDYVEPTMTTKVAALSLESLKTAIDNIENERGASVSSNPSSSIKLENIIDVENVFGLIKTEMTRLLSRSQNRIKQETQIIDLLSFYFSMIDDSISVAAFGSAAYGFGGTNTNFNILIKTSKNQNYSNSSEFRISIVYIGFRCIKLLPGSLDAIIGRFS